MGLEGGQLKKSCLPIRIFTLGMYSIVDRMLPSMQEALVWVIPILLGQKQEDHSFLPLWGVQGQPEIQETLSQSGGGFLGLSDKVLT